MESLPTEILDHIFNQFPSKCKLCQKKCLRASPRYVLSKCSNTCVRWNGLVEEKIVEIDKLKKCYITKPKFKKSYSCLLCDTVFIKKESWRIHKIGRHNGKGNFTSFFKIFNFHHMNISRRVFLKIINFRLEM